jgi:hypothetical protein
MSNELNGVKKSQILNKKGSFNQHMICLATTKKTKADQT